MCNLVILRFLGQIQSADGQSEAPRPKKITWFRPQMAMLWTNGCDLAEGRESILISKTLDKLLSRMSWYCYLFLPIMPLSCFWNCSNAQQMFWREQQAQRWLDSMVVSCSFMGDTQFWDILDLLKVYIYTYILVAGSHGRTSHPVVTRCHLCLYTLPNFSWRSKRWDIVGPCWTDVELIQLYMWMDRWRGKFCSGIRGLDCRPWTLGSRECCTFQEQLRNWC